MGIAPTGGRTTLSGIHVMRVEGGKVVEHWGQQDSLGLMRKLGAIPAASGDEIVAVEPLTPRPGPLGR